MTGRHTVLTPPGLARLLDDTAKMVTVILGELCDDDTPAAELEVTVAGVLGAARRCLSACDALTATLKRREARKGCRRLRVVAGTAVQSTAGGRG